MNERREQNVSVDPLNNSRRITRSMSLLGNGSENSLPIPTDLIILIFSKLDLKSIAKCRCVSKHWAYILRRSDFTELFLSKSTGSPKLLFTFKNRSELFIFSSPQPQNPDENSSPIVSNYQIEFFFDDYCQSGDLVHGLICFDYIVNLMIFNPSTGQTIILPKPKNSRENTWWSLFGYDPIDEKFKVLSMRKRVGEQHYIHRCDEYQVLTIEGSGTMSWKTIDCSVPHNPPREKICINGVIYYTPIRWLPTNCQIVCFDVRFEKFSFIKAIGMISSLKTIGIMDRAVWEEPTISLINFNGKLGLLLCQDGERFEIFDGTSISFKLWVLEDLEKQIWSDHTFLFHTVVPENIIEEVLLIFVGMTKTNEIVFQPSRSHYPFYLFFFNLEKKTIERVLIQGIEAFMDEHNGIEHIFLNHVENVKLY